MSPENKSVYSIYLPYYDNSLIMLCCLDLSSSQYNMVVISLIPLFQIIFLSA